MRRVFMSLIAVTLSVNINAQVNVTATGGTLNTSYTTLKGAFDAINAGTHTGTITIGISSDAIETASAVLNADGSGSASYNTITISPTGGTARIISGAIAGPLVDLNGADNVTIDGLSTGGNSLTISNTATGIVNAIRFIADATNNIIQNCTLTGSGSAVVSFSTGTTIGNDGNNINHCNITAAGANFPTSCIASTGSSVAVSNGDNTINANNVSDYFNATSNTYGIYIGAYNSAWLITNNKLFQTATRLYTAAVTHYGIYLFSGDPIISGNIIGFANSNGTGTTNMVGNSVPLSGTFPSAYNVTGNAVAIRYIGIYCFPANDNNPVTNIQGNTVAGFAFFTGSTESSQNGVWCGIFVQQAYANIGTTAGNTIGSTSGTGSVYVACTVSGAAVVGIYAAGYNTLNIQNNAIGAIDAMGTTTSVCSNIKGINTGWAGDPAGYRLGNATVTGNTIGNATDPNLRMGNLKTGSFLSNTGTTFSASSGISQFYGILNYQTSTVVIGSPAMPNIIRNVYQNSTSSSTSARGIYDDAATSLTISNNTVTQIISKSTLTYNLAGISAMNFSSNQSGRTIELNSISGLRAITTGPYSIIVIGIDVGDTYGTSYVRRNKVYDLTNTCTGTLPQIWGIILANPYVQGCTFSNNMVSLVNGANANPVRIIGIYDAGPSSSNQFSNYYFNSVNIGGSASSGAIGSYAFYRYGNPTTNHRNNLYTNTRTGGTGIHYTIYFASATPATGWPATASDHNVFNTAGSIIGHWGTADVNLAGWQSNSLGDYNSLSAIPLTFVNAANGDLHLNMGVTPTLIESGGVVIPGISVDYDNESRPGPVGSVNGGTFAPDIGADEFDGVPSITIYTFNGNGNWSNDANWVNNLKPPSTLATGNKIFIDPAPGGQCVLDITQFITTSAAITVRSGKLFIIPGYLTITQ